MTRIVVDASVVLSSLIAAGETRALLLGHYALELYTPDVLRVQVGKHLSTLARRTSKPSEVIEALLREVILSVDVVPTSAFAAYLPSARRRAKAGHAVGDEAYIALAELLSAAVWSYDKDFRRVKGLTVLATADVRNLVERSLRAEE